MCFTRNAITKFVTITITNLINTTKRRINSVETYLETTINWQWAIAASTKSAESSWKPTVIKTISK